jgi:hypothetical protein
MIECLDCHYVGSPDVRGYCTRCRSLAVVPSNAHMFPAFAFLVHAHDKIVNDGGFAPRDRAMACTILWRIAYNMPIGAEVYHE